MTSSSSLNSKEIQNVLARVRDICLALPEACEVEAWGHPTFRAGKKMFASLGGAVGQITLGFNAGFTRQAELLKDDRFYPAPYAAHRGWVSTDITPKTNWMDLEQLIRDAYRQVANQRMRKAMGE